MRITTLLAAAGLATAAAAQPSVFINEFQPNPDGGDPDRVSVELRGEAGTTFTGFLIGIENDGANGVVNNSGVDDDIEMISGTFDSNGLLVVEVGDFENPSFTLILTDSFTGENEDGDNPTDIDTDDDGIPDDLSDFGTIFDAIGIADSSGDAAVNYASALGGVSIAFTGDEPGLVFRDGLDPSTVYAFNDPAEGVAFDQFGNEFDLATDFFTVDGNPVDLSALVVDGFPSFDTFGSQNFTTIPTPGAFGVFAAAGLAAARRRRA